MDAHETWEIRVVWNCGTHKLHFALAFLQILASVPSLVEHDLALMGIKCMRFKISGIYIIIFNIFKNTTTLLNLRDMFRCFKHHLQP